MMQELEPAERWIWFGFLLLAGDSPYEGKIAVTETVGYTDEQLASILKVNAVEILNAKTSMIKHKKITVNKKTKIITICNWKKYQSEYKRQRTYRGKLQDKVTPKGDTLERDIERDKEKEEEREKELKKEFENFWTGYRSIGNKKDDIGSKQEAFKAYKALRKKEDVSTIEAAYEGYSNFLKNKEVHDKFQQRKKYASTWLRSERWKEFIGVEYTPPL